MDNPGHALDMGFTQEVIPECHHMCLIYDDEAQRRKIVSQYLAAGLKGGELIRYFADVTPAQEVRAWLMELGAEFSEAEKKGTFSISPAESYYCASGRLVPEQVIDSAKSRYAMIQKAGYAGSRVCAEMTWALRGIPGSDRLLEYETLLNTLQPPVPFIGMCQYDARLFDGATLFQVLQVHPYMIAQGQIVRNPFYLRPEEFLAKLRVNA